MKQFPALDVDAADDLTLADVDDFAPTAVEELSTGARIFFASPGQRNAALTHLSSLGRTAVSVDVPDDDWAARSQKNLTPVTVGRFTIVPRPMAGDAGSESDTNPYVVVIEPSMGFGTGHHATTRLCLAALQACDVAGSIVLDVGTGSGVLAMAAARLGATRAHGLDVDADAIESALRNLALNPDAHDVTFAVADLWSATLPAADIVVANLTGAALARSAPLLLSAVRPGGTIIISGILDTEEDDVRRAFGSTAMVQRDQESEWVCLRMKIS